MIGWPNGLKKVCQVRPSFAGLSAAKLLTRDEARRITASIGKLPDLLKTRGRDKVGGERDQASVHNPTTGSKLYAFVHACALRSRRGDRDSCALCSVPSRSLSASET